VTTADSHFDLFSATRTALKASPITWTYKHVKGNQDKDPDITLDQWAKLNIQMDSLAKMYWLETFHLSSHNRDLALTGELWPVFHNMHKIHSSTIQAIQGDLSQ
jgi:hypothetical protein